MLLALDIGNSNIFAGIFDNNKLVLVFRIPLNKGMSSAEFEEFISSELKKKTTPDSDYSAAISSVVPEINRSLSKVLTDNFRLNPFFIRHPVKTNLEYQIDSLAELGADRLVNAEAAFAKYKKDMIVIDFGTATTFDCLTASGEFLGGVIAPGLGISADALFSQTSRLPEVSLQKPESVIGKNTANCIQSGLMNGYFSMTDGLILKLKDQMKRDSFVIATGGFANIMLDNCSYIDKVNKNLTLEGIKIVYELNA